MMPVCCLERLGVGVGWSVRVREATERGPQRATCTHQSRSRGLDRGGRMLQGSAPEAWEEPVHEGRPPGLGLENAAGSQSRS